jgi:CO/xanthine dehydrogenase Mo-binding subunit
MVAQTEGSIIYGLGHVLREQIVIKAAVADQLTD